MRTQRSAHGSVSAAGVGGTTASTFHESADRDAAPAPVRRGAGRIMLAVVLGLAALGLAVVGLTVNTRFAASFGQTAEAALLLAAIGLTIDLLAIVLPSAAAQLWRDRTPHGGARPPGRSGSSRSA